jgi:hypothetical protein
MKLTDIINEEKYTIIDPKGNPAGTGTKDQANQRQKKLGGSKKGYFVVPAKKALKARRTLEKYKFDFKSTKLQDLMSDLYFESVNEAQVVNKKTGKDITRHVLDLMSGKIDKKKFEKLTGLKKESVNEAYDFKPNKNMNNLMKGRKIKNVVYSDKLGFAIILDNGKFVLIRGHRATPGSEKELELESVNEGFSTEEKRIVLMAVKKISKYMNVDLPTAMNYLLGAGQELERDIKKGKIK